MVGLVREATEAERELFWKWFVGGASPVSARLLSDAVRLDVNYDGKRLEVVESTMLRGEGHYVFNPVLVGSDLKVMEAEAARRRREARGGRR